MGATVKGTTVASKTIEHDDDVGLDQTSGRVPTVTLNSMGSSPTVDSVLGSGGHVRIKVTSGTGTPAIATNNIVVTLPTGTLPRKVFIASLKTITPCFHVSSVSNNVINIGTKVAPAVSTAYEVELIVLF